jgi:hypothetical protein
MLDLGKPVHVSALALPAGVAAVTRGKLDPSLRQPWCERTSRKVVEAAPEARRRSTGSGSQARRSESPEKKESGKDDKKK